ncbi:MAG: hemerythrin domain-containing protein [Alphaproteobacteria bacterium]|nr:hemerythrin domain-containing protein [Alphaproteobacteria bacterium]
MKDLERFRNEHAEILGIAYEIRHLLQPNHVPDNASILHALIAKLMRKTLAHLLQEDRSVYQELLLSEHEPTRMLARNHVQNMGSFADGLKSYLQEWPDTQTLKNKPEQFCEQTETLIANLERHIDQEERSLYPFSEAMA